MPEGNKQLGRLRRRWEDKIEIDLWEIGMDGENWTQLAQDRVRWGALESTVMNFRVPLRKQDIILQAE
jgi:hypothetical protein